MQETLHPIQVGEETFYGIPYKEPFMPVANGYGFEGVLLHNKERNKVQCHVCGEWFGRIDCSHIRKHGYANVRDYKDEYGFKRSAVLISESCRTKLIKHGQQQVRAGILRPFHQGNRFKYPHSLIQSRQAGRGEQTAEYKNEHDTCRLQLLRRLKDFSTKMGKVDISINDIRNSDDKSLPSLLFKYFGSFNKAKEIAGLIQNQQRVRIQIPQEIIIQELLDFHSQMGRNPTYSDIERGLFTFKRKALIHQFGKLNSALLTAGLKPNTWLNGQNGGKHSVNKM